AARKGPPVTIRFRLRVSAGREAPRYRWVEARLAPSPAADGVAVMAIRDASVMVEQEELLRRAQEDASAARGARSAFLSTINHELRTPLNAVLGFSEVMANAETRPADPARIGEYAGLIHGAGRELLRTVNAMIDVTRLESGVYELDTEEGDLRTAVEGAIEAFREEHPATDIRIDLPHSPVSLAYDERALRTVIVELLSNAAKFGCKGGLIRVGVRQEKAGAHLFVRDEGAGIPAEKVANLGRHFARLDDGLARAQGGVGLGLSLVHGLVALHGGKVTIASTAGIGTTFTVTLPGVFAASSNIHRLERAKEDRDTGVPEDSSAQDRERLSA
ncbi:MAG: sensor histidine kinase, partial [Beijerinckiaceae bacterium]